MLALPPTFRKCEVTGPLTSPTELLPVGTQLPPYYVVRLTGFFNIHVLMTRLATYKKSQPNIIEMRPATPGAELLLSYKKRIVIPLNKNHSAERPGF